MTGNAVLPEYGHHITPKVDLRGGLSVEGSGGDENRQQRLQRRSEHASLRKWTPHLRPFARNEQSKMSDPRAFLRAAPISQPPPGFSASLGRCAGGGGQGTSQADLPRTAKTLRPSSLLGVSDVCTETRAVWDAIQLIEQVRVRQPISGPGRTASTSRSQGARRGHWPSSLSED